MIGDCGVVNKREKKIQRHPNESKAERTESRMDMARTKETGESSGVSKTARDEEYSLAGEIQCGEWEGKWCGK
jgi:hypothetical protein